MRAEGYPVLNTLIHGLISIYNAKREVVYQTTNSGTVFQVIYLYILVVYQILCGKNNEGKRTVV